MGHQQQNQHTHFGSPRSRRDLERGREIFEEIMAGNFPNLKQGMNLQTQET